MTAMLLLAMNFVRSQWLFLVIMVTYLLTMAGVIGWHQQRPEVVFYVRLESAYVLGFGMLIALPAIQTDIKSRRIVAVLSKGIHRWQYVGGLLCGCMMITAFLCAVVWGSVELLAAQGSLPATGLTQIMIVLFLGSAAAASVAMFWSVVLHPKLAAGATLAVLLLPVMLESRGIYRLSGLFPVYQVFRVVNDFRFQNPGAGLWHIAAAATLQAVIFWVAASVLFARKDVTVTSE